jgi:hypothetical protein
MSPPSSALRAASLSAASAPLDELRVLPIGRTSSKYGKCHLSGASTTPSREMKKFALILRRAPPGLSRKQDVHLTGRHRHALNASAPDGLELVEHPPRPPDGVAVGVDELLAAPTLL